MQTNITLSLIVTLIIVTGFLTSCQSTPPTPKAPPTEASAPPPTGDGETILNNGCTACHNLDRVKRAKKTRDQWQKTVVNMINKGAEVSEAEQPVLLDYLANSYKP